VLKEVSLPVPPLSVHRPKSAFLPTVLGLALLSGCGGGGDDSGGTGVSQYLPVFDAPAPVAISVLTWGFSIGPNVVSDTSALLASPKYQSTRSTIAWLRQNIDSAVPNSGLLYALQSSGAAFAHAAGLDGIGQTIAISDSHISPTHEAFGVSRLQVLSNGPAVRCNQQGQCSPDEHGTSVASVAAGNASGFIGIAPEADILFGTFDTDLELAELGVRALADRAVAWNNSWGYSTLRLNQIGFNAAFAGTDGQAYLASLRNYAAHGVVVFAVSNIDSGSAGLMDGLPWLEHQFEAGWLAVANGVPTFSMGEISSVYLLSSPCYQSARWCLVADGTWNAAYGPDDEYRPTTGSSFAAPQVSGALALLGEAFPTLSPHELRIRLLASAADGFFTPDARVELADGFFKGYSVIFGHGFLDIAAALRPIGGTTMSMASGASLSTDKPVLRTGTAFGDAVEVSLAGTNVAVRDALSAGFAMPADALTSGARPGPQAGKLLADSLRGNLAAERLAAPSAVASPFAAFTGPIVTMSAPDARTSASVLIPQDGTEAAGLSLTRALTEGLTRIDLGLKLARDNGGMMSLDGENSAAMASVTLGITQDLGAGTFLALTGEVGVTDLGGATAFGDTGTARFDAVRLVAGVSDVFTSGDRLTIGVGRPVAIASGQTVLDLPVFREGAAVGFERLAVDLAPQDRQRDLELTYQTALRNGLEVKLSLIHSDDFGNRAGLTDTSGAIAFAFRF